MIEMYDLTITGPFNLPQKQWFQRPIHDDDLELPAKYELYINDRQCGSIPKIVTCGFPLESLEKTELTQEFGELQYIKRLHNLNSKFVSVNHHWHLTLDSDSNLTPFFITINNHNIRNPITDIRTNEKVLSLSKISGQGINQLYIVGQRDTYKPFHLVIHRLNDHDNNQAISIY